MLTPATPSDLRSHVPFDADRLDRLMDEAGLDVLVATSKHNVQYLLGVHRALFFDYMDAMGVGRYLPVFVYVKGATDKAAYFGHRLEGYQRQVKPFWVATAETASSGSVDAMQKAIDHIRRLELRQRARKSADELQKLRIASDRVIDSMLAVVDTHGPGTTKLELAEALRREETNRGLTFEDCLLAAGTSHNRAPSEQQWEEGDVLSLDSGGNYHGYIG